MSYREESKTDKENSLSIPEILADFFLKKIDMPSHSDDSDHRHKSKKKKSKHKKRKHKKSKHRHRSSSSDSSGKTSDRNTKQVVDDISSSEEMGIKRLKKIRNLKLQSATKNVPQSTECETKDKSNPPTNENVVYYGPSLELLLTGVESNSDLKPNDSPKVEIKKEHCEPGLKEIKDSIKNEKQCSNVKTEEKILVVSSDSVDSKTEKIKSICTEDKDVPHKDANNQINDSKSDMKSEEPIVKKECDSSKEITGKNAKTILAKDVKLAKDIDSSDTKHTKNTDSLDAKHAKNIDSLGFKHVKTIDSSDTKHSKNIDSSDAKQAKSSDSLDPKQAKSSDSPDAKLAKNTDSSDAKKSTTEIIKNDSSVEKIKEKSGSKKRHSRSRSKSRSKHSPISKQKRRKSRSTSRDSHSTRKKKRYSRSRSREKSPVRKRRSYSRSRSRSRLDKHRRSRSRSPRERFRARRPRSRSHSRSRYRKRSDSRTRRRSRSKHRERSRSRSKHRERPRSRSKHRDRSRSRSKHQERSRSRSKHRDRSRSRSKHRDRSKSRSKHRDRSRSRSRHKSTKRSKSRSRSKSKSKTQHASPSKAKSRSRSKEKKSTKIDQAKVLETARKNVLKMMKNGTLPEGLPVENLKKEQIISIQSGGKSVQELTDFCQRLSQKENDPDPSENEDNEDKADDETGFIHHPFKVKEPAMIKLNIKNAVQLPIKTHAQKVAELSSQFPVSSGNQHKQKELEWVPVVPETTKAETKTSQAVVPKAAEISAIPVPPEIPAPALPPPPPPPNVPISYPLAIEAPPPVEIPTSLQALMPPPPPPPMPAPPMPPPLPPSTMFYEMPVQPVMNTYVTPSQPMMMPFSSASVPSSVPTSMPTLSLAPSTSVFKPPKKLDISSIVAKRFQAVTKLQENPNDPDALRTIQEAQESIQEWVQSQQVPGLFTGSTDAKILTAAELCGPFKYQPKNRKDVLIRAPPVTGGKGMSLLKKMGWNPGEGLGKNKEGSLEPLVLDIKTDKKGLVSEGENSKKIVSSFIKELQGKHPVSALMELCSKRRWKPPLYTCVLDHGPPHKKVFCFKVEVNGVEYQPVNPCPNKKIAKADAAVLCLQSLNVLPKTS